MSDTKLLPCPFCGNTRVRVDALLGDDWFVSCEKNSVAARGCWMSLYAIHPTRELAIAAWNTRTPDPRIEAAQGLADALKAVKQEWPHEAPEHCYSTGPYTGDIVADHIACPGCSLQRTIDRALAAWEKLQ